MTISRRKQRVQVIAAAATLDIYGQPQSGTTRYVDMTIIQNGMSETNNPQMVMVDAIGLTKAAIDITDKVVVGSKTYRINRLLPSGRYTQLHLVEIK